MKFGLQDESVRSSVTRFVTIRTKNREQVTPTKWGARSGYVSVFRQTVLIMSQFHTKTRLTLKQNELGDLFLGIKVAFC